MKLTINGRNIEVTDALKTTIEKKMGKLDKYFNLSGPVEAYVKLEVVREQHIVEVTLFVGGMILRAEERLNDMYASIDEVVDKLERQIHKYKTRVNRKMREASEVSAIDRNALEDERQNEPRIVRTKRFSMKPMSPEEAVLQMELLGHSFYVFIDDVSDEVNVVYKRKDGNYGLIEPIS